MAKHNVIGKEGEEIAAEYLRKKGYEIIALNKRFDRAEIDIIAQMGKEFVFVEVKTRTNAWFGFPEEAIDKSKIELMGKAAEQFCIEREEESDIRFDLVSIVHEKGEYKIIHIEDAFFPGSEEF